MFHSLHKVFFLLTVFNFLIFTSFLYPQDDEQQVNIPDTASVININNWELWVNREGGFEHTGVTFSGGRYHNIGTIYASGLLWGGCVYDGADTTIRVNGYKYSSGLKPGKVLYSESGDVIGSESEERTKIWRMRRDYQTADLTEDAASIFEKNIEEIIETDLLTVYDQYEYDWQNWPADQGAPYIDMDNDNKYDPTIDIPGRPNARQLIWLVANDLPDSNGKANSYNLHGSPPIGIEQQLSVWTTDEIEMGYSYTYSKMMQDVVVLDYKIIYTGLPETPNDAFIDPMYFCQWADPDIGEYANDLIGVDTTIALGYAYNGEPNDQYYDVYEINPHSVGFSFLKMPLFNGEEVNLSGFGERIHISEYVDPYYQDYSWSLKIFNLMEGYESEPTINNNDLPRQRFIDPTTGNPTRFMYYGNPIDSTGWIATDMGDAQFYLSCGPFRMAVGDTQNITIALIGGNGGDYLENVGILLDRTKLLKSFYQSGYFDIEEIKREEPDPPDYFGIYKNYPNPFNGFTVIRYNLPVDRNVEIAIYNMLGEKVTTILNEYQKAGEKEVVWNGTDNYGRDVGSGIYFYRISAKEFAGGHKMVLIK